MDPQRHIGRATAALVAAMLFATAACSSKLEEPESLPEQPKPRPSIAAAALNPDQQVLIDKVWANFLKLNEIYLQAAHTGNYNWDPKVEKRPMYPYAAGNLLAYLERDLDMMQDQGLIRTGASNITLRRVVSVSPNSIVIESCNDDTGTDTINKTTRKSVSAPNQNKKYPVTLRAGLFPDGLWRWVESQADRGSSC